MPANPVAAPAGRRSAGRIDPEVWRVVTALILGSIMAVLDTTIVNVALESLSRDLHTDLNGIQWVVTAYLLALAAVIPMTAWGARRFGAKRLYLVAIVLFTLGSALCGLSTSTVELILFRVIQGVGGGIIVPVGQMILVKASGPRNLARVMSAYGVPVILAPVLGPTVGGLLLDNVGWRWIFFVNVPIGVAAFFRCWKRLPSEPPGDAGRFDLPGLGLVATGLVGVTYGLAKIGSSGKSLAEVALPLLGGLVLVAAFVVRSLRTERPLLDMRLYANKAFSAASVTTFCLGAALFGGGILMPLYFQTVRHEDPLYTGLLLLPRGIGAAAGTWASGRMMDEVGAGVTAAIGSLATLVFMIPFVMLGAHTSYLVIGTFMVFQGFGIGLSAMPAMTAAFRALRPNQVNDASPQLNILMRVGGSIGTALLTVVLQRQLTKAGRSLSAQAQAFGTTFWIVLLITAVAVAATTVLIVMERRQARSPSRAEASAPEVAPHLLETN